MTIVHVETTPAEREAAEADLIRVLNRLRERARRHKSDLVVKVQPTDNSLSQTKEVVTR